MEKVKNKKKGTKGKNQAEMKTPTRLRFLYYEIYSQSV